MEGSQITRARGRPRKTTRETIRKDLEVNELEKDMVFDTTLQCRLIHVGLVVVDVADPLSGIRLSFYILWRNFILACEMERAPRLPAFVFYTFQFIYLNVFIPSS